MKKCISVILLIGTLLSCCGCQNKPAATEPAATAPIVKDEMSMTPEELYGDIDESQPVDGIYKIWSIKGVEQLAKHPDAKFEVLCHIDLQGATLAPIPEFTGEIVGGAWTIKNFTVAGQGESFGLIGVNKGSITNINFENVTLQPGSDAKNIGALAGVNEGTFLRCTIGGTLSVQAQSDGICAGSVVGVNRGSLANIGTSVDLTVAGQGKTRAGAIAGLAEGGKIEYVDTTGCLTLTGDNMTAGLFAAEATNVVFTDCVFGGWDNSLNGQLFVNFTGNPDDDELAVALNGLWRDNAYHPPLPENVAKLRQKVVDEMYQLVTIRWKPRQDFPFSCNCTGGVCSGVFSADYDYVGIPYNHGRSSLRRTQYVIGEDGYLKDWVYDLPQFDGLQVYLGGDCSSTLQQAWWTVNNDTEWIFTATMYPAYGLGTIPVGDYKCDFQLKNEKVDGFNMKLSRQYIDVNTPEKIYECYALCRYGDAIVNSAIAGGHTRMLAEDPVIIKNQAGQIDPDHSYMLMHEQGGGFFQDDKNMRVTYGGANKKFTFANLYYDWYVPITCKELISGEMDPVECTLVDGCEGYAGMLTGTIKTNYHLDFATLKVTDSKGNAVLEHVQFTGAAKRGDTNGYMQRCMYTEMDLSDFSAIVQQTKFQKGEKYSYSITASLATYDDVVVKEGSFTIGN